MQTASLSADAHAITDAGSSFAAVTPIDRRSLHDTLVSRIRDMIIEGVLAPGQRVHEGQLGLALGVSRTPLREALKFLASEGVIDLVPGRGAVVHRLSPKDVHDMLEVLGAMEAQAGRLACARASAAEIAGVRRLHDEMMGCYAARSRLEYYKRNQAIHSAIARLSGNGFLAATHETIQARLKRIRFIGHEGAEKWQSAVAEHAEIIDALGEHDADRLAAILIAHLDGAWERVRDAL